MGPFSVDKVEKIATIPTPLQALCGHSLFKEAAQELEGAGMI
jgi:hypothetical protein